MLMCPHCPVETSRLGSDTQNQFSLKLTLINSHAPHRLIRINGDGFLGSTCPPALHFICENHNALTSYWTRSRFDLQAICSS